MNCSLSIEWNSMRLGGPTHRIVTKLCMKLDQGMVGVRGSRVVGLGREGSEGRWGVWGWRGLKGGRGLGVGIVYGL